MPVTYEPKGRGSKWRGAGGRFVEKPELAIPLEEFQAKVASRIHEWVASYLPAIDRQASEILNALAQVKAKDITLEDYTNAAEVERGIEQLAGQPTAEILQLVDWAWRMAQEAMKPVTAVTGPPVRTQRYGPYELWQPMYTPLAHTIAPVLAEPEQGYHAINALTTLASSDIAELSRVDAHTSLIYSLSDLLFRTGRLVSRASAVGYLVSGPSAITFALKPKFSALEAIFGELATEEGMAGLISTTINATKDRIIQTYVQQLRMRMATKNVQALGGSYSAPITNTGKLAAAIGEIPEHPNKAKKGDLPGGSDGTVMVATIGISRPGRKTNRSQPPGLYGEVLARARPSSPPSARYTPAQFFGASKGRFKAWGASRGLYDEEIERIMAKIYKRGTYGRAWMTQLALDITPTANFDFVGREMQKQIEEAMELAAG